ncbi:MULTISPECIES: YdeI/OmpD-associated family protein [Enterococcus]|uniref:YdeI/OmpD-associated family protein n=1 Tax=Candidatus Enterococcus murrayae TaxID=2815321 RepID=A0ABS3HH38_9ENTE|nr:YdeI/OmpD-associated family protein [Enterococcus sp. MJM16]MBO0452752.1 YdeI/OmpD-associated family protein [Enterococcus sp. MJM16]
MTHLFIPQNRQELRDWLTKNAEILNVAWIVIDREQSNLTYLDIVEEALCFGWIDSTKKKLSDTATAQRLSPRTKKSQWTELNKERARRLIALNLMTDLGRAALPDLSPENFVIDSTILERLAADPEIQQNFSAFPKLYQRIKIDNIQRYGSDNKLFEQRLEKLLVNTKANKLFGAWDDDGKLSDYK